MAWSKSTRIIIMLSIDILFLIVEMGVGVAVGSLALVADAFHMLNDVISLAVGLWAVLVAQTSSSDKYTFGYLRAEILGAFFNAVFLIALCLSILLEALPRLINPPEIQNPKLILIVGCLGLASNIVGFFVLGSHGHSHGHKEDDDGHDTESTGNAHAHNDNFHATDEEVNLKPATRPQPLDTKHALASHAELPYPSKKDHEPSVEGLLSTHQHQKSNSISKGSRSKQADFVIHPASFRRNIIAASRPLLDGASSDASISSDDEDETEVAETRPLLQPSTEHHPRNHAKHRGQDSWHHGHKHRLPKQSKKGSHHHHDLAMNAIILHVIGDALGNVGVIISALIIWLTDYSARYFADPAVSLFITLIIMRSTIPLTIATAKILLQATPDHIQVHDIKDDIEALPGVVGCHHIHIWQLSDTQIVASMHIQLDFSISETSEQKYMDIARAVRICLHAYGIHSATIQPEFCLVQEHAHGPHRSRIIGLGGYDGQVACRLDDNTCLIECVENCQAKPCCSPKASPQ
ncbi:unnamed protein product [Blumeria hordei]|uniref:Uncharacterized protein n=1 Tax=Blumeria hordei TaxID=2867405 RepID=A0A383UNB9_BLUHO|nr:unnamed protein product [Blumeria hordei]